MPVISDRLNETWIFFSTDFFRKKNLMSNFVQILRQLGAKLFRTGGKTDKRADMTKTKQSLYANFANALRTNKLIFV